MAVRLILSTDAAGADPVAVRDFLDFAAQRGIDLSQTHVAQQGAELLWAALPMASPGRTMLLFSAPCGSEEPQRQAARQLVEALMQQFQDRGTHLAQVLLDPPQRSTQAFYESCGFRRMAELIYLQTLLRRVAPLPAMHESFQWQTYSPASHAQFAAAISDSYQDSLDCPGLNGLREIEDIIIGHKATGQFDPALWFLLREHEAARGVLLLSPMPASDALELVYLGLTPGARGRGLGNAMMRQALTTAHTRGFSRLSLAVDSQNAPALRLYYRHGLQRVCSKLALMRDLRH